MPRLDGIPDVLMLMPRDVGPARVAKPKDRRNVRATRLIPEICANQTAKVLRQGYSELGRTVPCSAMVFGVERDLRPLRHDGAIIPSERELPESSG